MEPDQQSTKPYISPEPTRHERRLTDFQKVSGTNIARVQIAHPAVHRGYTSDLRQIGTYFMSGVICLFVSGLRQFGGEAIPVVLAVLSVLAIVIAVATTVASTIGNAVLLKVNESPLLIRHRRYSLMIHSAEVVLAALWLIWLLDAIAISGLAFLLLWTLLAGVVVSLRVARPQIKIGLNVWGRQ